ncbi:hypothetical protein SCALM49S_02531 [Streptomyces californicus]
MAGEEPWASARMRCFIVGGRARSRGRVHRTEGAYGVAAVASVCSWVVALGVGAVFVAFAAFAVAAAAVARPSDARSGGGLLVYRQIQADRAEQDLWTEATDSVPAGSGV